jgi:hypothetical protein
LGFSDKILLSRPHILECSDQKGQFGRNFSASLCTPLTTV